MKLFTLKKNKLFYLYFIAAFLFLVFGFFIFPLWSNVEVPWSKFLYSIINLIIAIFLIIYLIFFLLKKLKKGKKSVIQVLSIIEFVILSIISIICILSLFIKEINTYFSLSKILGMCIYFRGVIGAFEGYLYNKGDSKKYPIWAFVIDILLIGLGVFFYVKPIISDLVVLWIFFVLIVIIVIILVICGIVTIPEKKNKE